MSNTSVSIFDLLQVVCPICLSKLNAGSLMEPEDSRFAHYLGCFNPRCQWFYKKGL